MNRKALRTALFVSTGAMLFILGRFSAFPAQNATAESPREPLSHTNAGLDRRIARLRFDGVPFDQASGIVTLPRFCGTCEARRISTVAKTTAQRDGGSCRVLPTPNGALSSNRRDEGAQVLFVAAPASDR